MRLTGSHAEVGPYPYTTKLPLPGMLAFEDVHFQLIDLPPIAAAYMEPWMGSALEHADAACLVVDGAVGKLTAALRMQDLGEDLKAAGE